MIVMSAGLPSAIFPSPYWSIRSNAFAGAALMALAISSGVRIPGSTSFVIARPTAVSSPTIPKAQVFMDPNFSLTA